MTRFRMVFIALAALVACAPEARTYVWYKAHPDQAASVTAACGPRRSEDCANAEQALADVKYEQRMSVYRKAF